MRCPSELVYIGAKGTFRKFVRSAKNGYLKIALWKFWSKNKRVFFGVRCPSELVYIGAKGTFRKFVRSAKNGYLKINKNEDAIEDDSEVQSNSFAEQVVKIN